MEGMECESLQEAELEPLALLQQIKLEGGNWIAAGAVQLGCLFVI